VDDLFLDVATLIEVRHTRDTLARLCTAGAQLDLSGALTCCASVRPIRLPPIFSVTSSTVGRRNYSTPEITAALANGVARGHGWAYSTDDRLADLNLRIFIEHATAYVGMRLAKSPLHDRGYQRIHRPGALKASVAAALSSLAGITPGTRVLDPCCGTGTIAIEAGRRGAVAYGGDIAPEAIDAARAHAASACVPATFAVMDAQRLPFADGAVDCVVSNLPWGCQVDAGPSLARFYRRSVAEMRRVLAPAGRVVLLTSVPQLVTVSDLRCVQQLQISLYGQRPTILVCML
jgi:23S rRNA G2445 N2-methylase RlmL